MRPQNVSVDVWKMVGTMCSYLALAAAAWLFLRLVHACLWLPKHLREQENAGGETPGEPGDSSAKKDV